MLRLTKYTAMRMGPAIALGAVAAPDKPPRSKTECKSKHHWNVRKYERRCFRCGRLEVRDATTRW